MGFLRTQGATLLGTLILYPYCAARFQLPRQLRKLRKPENYQGVPVGLTVPMQYHGRGLAVSCYAVIAKSKAIEEITMSDQPDKQGGKANEQEAAKIAMYEAIANRRLSLDSMMWQVPVLSLTAQAFLLTIALGSETSQFARSVSAGLACVTAVMSLQLMSKHRHHERLDSEMLERLEDTSAQTA